MGDLSHLQRWIDESPFGLYVGKIWQHEPLVTVDVNYPYHANGDEAQQESRLLHAVRLAYPAEDKGMPVVCMSCAWEGHHKDGPVQGAKCPQCNSGPIIPAASEILTCPRFIGELLQWEGGNDADSWSAAVREDPPLPAGWEQVIQLHILDFHGGSEDIELAQNLSRIEESFYEQLAEHPLFPIAFPDAPALQDELPCPYSIEIQVALIKEIDTSDFWRPTGGGYTIDDDRVSDAITGAAAVVVDTFVREQARKREASTKQEASFT